MQLDVCVEIRIGWLEWLVKEGARRVVTGVQVVPWLGVFCAHAQKPPPSRLSLSLSPQLSSPLSPFPSTDLLHKGPHFLHLSSASGPRLHFGISLSPFADASYNNTVPPTVVARALALLVRRGRW